MTVKLEAKKREVTGKKLFALRDAGKIPAILYGHGVENQNLELDYSKFEKLYERAGESTMIDLVIDGAEPMKILIADVQYEPTKHRFFHVDLKKINMKEKVTASIPVELVGEEPKAVKELGGVLVHNFSELEIRCLPADLIHEVKVDVSGLDTFDEVIMIKDLNLPETIEIIGHELEDVVATVTPPKIEEEPEPVAEAEEGEEGAEGEEAGGKEGIEGGENQDEEKKEEKTENK